MPQQRALARAVAAVLSGAVAAQPSLAQDGLEEVIVTARKREENLQDIPEAVTAFSSSDIARYGLKTLDDYARFVPSLTVVGTAPGQSKIVFRGVADSARPFIADPTSAIYLDEQPLTTGAVSPEVWPVDIERVEALSGPQATLYGASSQSGTVRILTNRPRADEFEANVGVSGHDVDGGGLGYSADATVNLPIVKDRLAIRFSGFSARDAGYIDNVLGSSKLRADITNADVVDEDFNSTDWLGGRLQARWWVTDDWTVNAGVNYQKTNVRGFNDYDPTVGDLERVNFFGEAWDDEWYQTSLIIEGDLGFARVLSATSYFERDTHYTRDASTYNSYLHYFSALDDYPTYGAYAAQYNLYDFSTTPFVDNAQGRAFWDNFQKDKRITQEIRLTGSASRWDWTLGFFYQYAKQHWEFEVVNPTYGRSEAFRARNFLAGGTLAPTNVSWHSGERNERTDIAVFGEVTFSVTDRLKLIGGGRWYDVDIEREYFQRQPATAPPDIATPSGSDSGFLPKAGVQYFFDEEVMVYFTYSEGFRAGGINRSRGQPTLPMQYDSDTLVNWEAGLKSQWFGNRLQVNLTGYHSVWKDMQLEVTDPSWQFGEVFQTVVTNVGDADIDGIEFEIVAVPIEGLEAGVSGTWLVRNELAEDFVVFDPRLPAQPTLSVAEGSQLPLVADFNLAMYVDYAWPVAFLDAEAFMRFQYSYTGDSINQLEPAPEPFPQLPQDEYHIGDVSFGLVKGPWEGTIYIDNVWDERAELYVDTSEGDRFFGGANIRTNQPRTFGFRLRRYF
jgi:outer membrane receptor protein involved in Fe transport